MGKMVFKRPDPQACTDNNLYSHKTV